MASDKPKKLLIMNILDILRRYTDAEHRLSQKEIVEILRDEYEMTVDRKSVKRNLENLIELGYTISFSESLRMIPNKDGKPEESYVLSDFYLEREFSDSELRLLIDSLLFSKHIPYSQCRQLVEKLEGLSNQYFKSRVRYIHTLPDSAPQNRQLFYTIEVLDEAIAQGRQVAFVYNRYGTDKKLHPEQNADGTVREYIVNPYQMAATNGRYYLIGNYDKYDNVAHYRLDRITDICLLNTSVKPMKRVEGLENGLNLPKHMAEHVYMFSGESGPVTFRMKTYLMNDCLDWFGKDVTFSDETADEVTVRVSVNYEAMRHWAVQYARHIRVLTPTHLAEQVKEDLQVGLAWYEEEHHER